MQIDSSYGLSLGDTMNITYERIQPAFWTADLGSLIHALRAELTVPASYYPGFSDWLNKVVLELTEGMRSLILARFQHKIVGVNILKHHEAENKLCTFWVNPEFRHQHIASKLLSMSLDSFQGKAPLITIPESRLGEFMFLIERRGFLPCGISDGLYHQHLREYFFTIPQMPAAPQERLIAQRSDWRNSAAHFAGQYRAMSGARG